MGMKKEEHISSFEYSQKIYKKHLNIILYTFPSNIFLNVSRLKRLHQGHLHPKLQVPGLTCPGRESNLASAIGGEHSRKKPLKIHITQSCFSYKFKGNNSLLNLHTLCSATVHC